MSDLESRLLRLEQSVRRWKIAAGSLLLLVIAGISMGQIIMGGGTGGMQAPLITVDRVIANKSITLNDAAGKPRLLFSNDPAVPAIQIKDKDDHTLLAITSDAKGATAILIQDADGKKLFSAP